jgi:hypothetical protein
MTYQLVYDVRTAGLQGWILPGVGGVLIAIAALQLYLYKTNLIRTRRPGLFQGAYVYLFLCLAISATAGSTFSML